MTTAPLADPPAMPSAPPGGVRGWLRRARAVVWGAGPPPAPPATTDRGTLLAEQRTEYAAQRTYLAAERTLMAWIRTSLSMISFGFTIVKVFEYLAAERRLLPGWFGHARSPATLGLALISIGTLALVFAVIQHWQTLRELHARGLAARWSLALTVATLVAVLGVYAFGSLVLHY
jgi:inner membrane protein YidH